MNGRVFWLVVAVVFLIPAVVHSQFDLQYISQEPYGGDLERPKVFFPHDRHNELAGIAGDDQCYLCHHVFEDGVLVKEDNSAGVPCADCHLVGEDQGNAPDLTTAYHRQCAGCHDKENKGPITCGDCHTGEVTGPRSY